MNKLLIIFYVFFQFISTTTPSVKNSISSENASVQTNSSTPCEDVDIDMSEKVMTIKNLKAPHVHIDVYKVDKNNGWKNVFTCNDNCGGPQMTVNVEPKQHYIVHIKFFSQQWEKICERQMTLDATNNQTTCDDVSVVTDDDKITIGNLTAPHQNVEIYQVEQSGAWTKVKSCNDCPDDFSTKIQPKQKHLIFIKMFDKQWAQICQKEIEYQP
jgi:hypothetical protein